MYNACWYHGLYTRQISGASVCVSTQRVVYSHELTIELVDQKGKSGICTCIDNAVVKVRRLQCGQTMLFYFCFLLLVWYFSPGDLVRTGMVEVVYDCSGRSSI
jgi:hypothetical protein